MYITYVRPAFDAYASHWSVLLHTPREISTFRGQLIGRTKISRLAREAVEIETSRTSVALLRFVSRVFCPRNNAPERTCPLATGRTRHYETRTSKELGRAALGKSSIVWKGGIDGQPNSRHSGPASEQVFTFVRWKSRGHNALPSPAFPDLVKAEILCPRKTDDFRSRRGPLFLARFL